MSDQGRRQSLPRIMAGTSSSTINTIQLMSKGVSSASPCEPVTCLVQPRHPGVSHPATTQGQVSSREPQRHGQTLNPRGHPMSAQPGRPRGGAAGAEPYRSHLRGGGYREGAEPCWLATMAVEERPGEEKRCQELEDRARHLGDSVRVPWPKGRCSSLPAQPHSHLLHRAGCTALAAASTRGGGGGDVSRAGAGRATCGAGRCSSPPHPLPRRCCSSHRPPPPHSHCGPAPETSSHLSGEEKADTC